jgi:elongation factor Ts
MAEVDLIKKLREKTGAGVMECKEALKEVAGDFNKAIEHLRKKGLAKAKRVSGKTAKEGKIESYVHLNDKIGVIVEINCETDFVAKNDDFKQFAKDIAMQIAARNPLYIKRDDIPDEVLEKERHIIKSQIEDKPENIKDKIVEGKMEKYFEEVCLMDQLFIKDDKITIKDYLNTLIGKIKEKIVIRRFARFQVGEEIEEESIQHE